MARELTLQDYRDITREWFDVDDEEMSDRLIDTWTQEGFDLAITPELSWQYYQHTFVFNTVADVGDYTLADGSNQEIHNIYAAYGPTARLGPVGHFSAQAAYASTDHTGEPAFYSVWQGRLSLWPVPDDDYEITVDGFRKPQDWIAGGSGATPDCPAEFHRPILAWVKSRAYFHQDDPENGAIFERQFSSELQAVRNRFRRDQVGVPIIMGRGRPVIFLTRPLYDWE